MDDADREGNVETFGKGQIIGARPYDLHRGKRGKVMPCASKRTLVDVDGVAATRPVGHRPIAVASHAAADVEKAPTLPICRGEVDRPAAKLLLVLRQDLGIGSPLVPKQ